MAGLAAALTLGACGGNARMDANEKAASYPVMVSTNSFPRVQRLAQHTDLVIAVHNVGSKPIPNVAVSICNTTCTYPAPNGQGTSVAAFAHLLNMPGLASHSRPVWIINRPPGPCQGAKGYSCLGGGPGGYVSADANTWQTASPLKPGDTATFKWGLTAVTSGKFVVAWQVAAGLNGKAKTVVPTGITPCGVTPCGTFAVTISRTPSLTHVNDRGGIVGGP